MLETFNSYKWKINSLVSPCEFIDRTGWEYRYISNNRHPQDSSPLACKCPWGPVWSTDSHTELPKALMPAQLSCFSIHHNSAEFSGVRATKLKEMP